VSGFRVAAALSQWGRTLRQWVHDHEPAMDVELVRSRLAVLDGGIDAVCLDLDQLWVDRSLIAALRERSVAVVGVYSSPAEDQQWRDWGVSERIDAAVEPQNMALLLSRLRPAFSPPTVPAEVARSDVVGRAPIVVGGAPGSGAREVLIGLAAVLARSSSTVVIDANESSPGVARRLGYAEQPNVLHAAQLAAAGGDPREAVAGTSVGRRAPFDMIAGLGSAAEWTEWPPQSALQVVEAAAGQWDSVLVATSPVVEDLRRWGDRYGVSRALLSSPEVRVVAAVEASPRGVLRFAEWLADAQPVWRIAVVINKVPPRSSYLLGEVRERVLSLAGGSRVEILGWLPLDRRVTRAEWDAALVTAGPFAKALHRLAPTLHTQPTRAWSKAAR
jgi:Mrp family chromosome partitioning ATPase